MRVLLTGGAGFIGTHTCIALIEAGYDVIVLDNLCNSSPEALRRVEELTGKRVPLYEADCTNERDVARVFAENAIDAVIHFAGLKSVPESVQKPILYYQNNLGATMTLCKVMKEYGVRRLVFSSSATVYGTNSQMPLNERAQTGCTNPYGWTKWMSERILSDAAAADGMSVVLLRYFNPIGAHPSGRIGEDPAGIPANIMPYICQVAAGKLNMVHVNGVDYDTPDGTGVRDYIHIMDLAEGHLAALRYSENHSGALTVNLGTGEGYSVYQLLHTFERVNCLTVPYEVAARRPGDIATCYADPTRAKETLGWQARRTLEDMCRDAWRWQKNNPNGYCEMEAKT